MFKLNGQWVDSDERAVLSVTGEDTTKFLHGQCTQDIKGLAVGQIVHAFTLTPKGKIVGDFHVLRIENGFFLFLDREQVSTVLAHLKKFIVIQKVVIEDETSLLATQLLPPDVCLWNAADLERERILQGIPRFGRDFNDENLPQETGLNECLHFNKGCYTGQEIVARLHFRGHVTKCLASITFSAPELSATDVAQLQFEADGKTIGPMTSFCLLPNGVWQGFLYVPYAFSEAQQPLFTADKKRFVHFKAIAL